MSNGRSGRVRYETAEGDREVRGTVGIEESGMVTVVRVRSDSEEYVIPWKRVVAIRYE